MNSPCIGICELTVDGSVCKGCYRTIKEISDWGSMSESQQQTIVDRLFDEPKED